MLPNLVFSVQKKGRSASLLYIYIYTHTHYIYIYVNYTYLFILCLSSLCLSVSLSLSLYTHNICMYRTANRWMIASDPLGRQGGTRVQNVTYAVLGTPLTAVVYEERHRVFEGQGPGLVSRLLRGDSCCNRGFQTGGCSRTPGFDSLSILFFTVLQFFCVSTIVLFPNRICFAGFMQTRFFVARMGGASPRRLIIF